MYCFPAQNKGKRNKKLTELSQTKEKKKPKSTKPRNGPTNDPISWLPQRPAQKPNFPPMYPLDQLLSQMQPSEASPEDITVQRNPRVQAMPPQEPQVKDIPNDTVPLVSFPDFADLNRKNPSSVKEVEKPPTTKVIPPSKEDNEEMNIPNRPNKKVQSAFTSKAPPKQKTEPEEAPVQSKPTPKQRQLAPTVNNLPQDVANPRKIYYLPIDVPQREIERRERPPLASVMTTDSVPHPMTHVAPPPLPSTSLLSFPPQAANSFSNFVDQESSTFERRIEQPTTTYSAHQENMRMQQQQQVNQQQFIKQQSHSEQRYTEHPSEVFEEIETITLQPIGKGVQDLESSKSATMPRTPGVATPMIFQQDSASSTESIHSARCPSMANSHHSEFRVVLPQREYHQRAKHQPHYREHHQQSVSYPIRCQQRAAGCSCSCQPAPPPTDVHLDCCNCCCEQQFHECHQCYDPCYESAPAICSPEYQHCNQCAAGQCSQNAAPFYSVEQGDYLDSGYHTQHEYMSYMPDTYHQSRYKNEFYDKPFTTNVQGYSNSMDDCPIRVQQRTTSTIVNPGGYYYTYQQPGSGAPEKSFRGDTMSPGFSTLPTGGGRLNQQYSTSTTHMNSMHRTQASQQQYGTLNHSANTLNTRTQQRAGISRQNSAYDRPINEDLTQRHFTTTSYAVAPNLLATPRPQSRSVSVSSFTEAHATNDNVYNGSLKQVQDTSKYWYLPTISRDEAINQLKYQAPGSFIVRDSTSFPNAFGLAVKVAALPPRVTLKTNDLQSELVRHYLIEPVGNNYVRLKGFEQEPVFPTLAALIHQHVHNALALPVRLIVPNPVAQGYSNLAGTADYAGVEQNLTPLTPATQNSFPMSQTDFQSYQPNNQVGASPVATTNYFQTPEPPTPQTNISNTFTNASNEYSTSSYEVLYLGSYDVDFTEGHKAVKVAIDHVLRYVYTNGRHIECQMDLSALEGITLTDLKKRLFMKRNFPPRLIAYCGFDPKNREYSIYEERRPSKSSIGKISCFSNIFRPLDAQTHRIFAFIVRKSGPGGLFSQHEGTCYVLAEFGLSQSAALIVKDVLRTLQYQPQSNTVPSSDINRPTATS